MNKLLCSHKLLHWENRSLQEIYVSTVSTVSYALSIPEIFEAIFGNTHPYYLYSLFRVNKEMRNIIESKRYNFLKNWCYPDSSLEELYNKFPLIRFSHMLEISLVYYPIPESICYYDRYTLMYHSVKSGNNWWLDNFDECDYKFQQTFLWIAYKFNRSDIFNILNIRNKFVSVIGSFDLYKLISYISQMLYVKNGWEIKDEDQCWKCHSTVEISLCRNQVLFTPEEWFETLIISKKVDYDMGKLNRNYTGIIHQPSPILNIIVYCHCDNTVKEYYDLVESIAEKLGFDKLKAISDKYGHFMFRSHPSTHYSRNKDWVGNSNNISIRKLRDNPELIDKVAGGSKCKLMYYIASGKFDLYIQAKSEGITIENMNSKLFRCCMNDFGYRTSNWYLLRQNYKSIKPIGNCSSHIAKYLQNDIIITTSNRRFICYEPIYKLITQQFVN